MKALEFGLWVSSMVSATLKGEAVLQQVQSVGHREQYSTDGPIRNANHIFNDIRGAMRQWDNSWNHNGMSFFLATVPVGVQLYHGTSKQEPVTGMQWLAFEPEHALMFAHNFTIPWHNSTRAKELEQLEQQSQDLTGPSPPLMAVAHHGENIHGPPLTPKQQIPKKKPMPGPPVGHFNGSGYLHFYHTFNELNLLYINGQSGAKTHRGTLDAEDYILGLGLYEPSDSVLVELERAQALCNLSQTLWGGAIDGFIRMECGFELILCNFESHLEFEQAERNIVAAPLPRGSHTTQLNHTALHFFNLYRAVADRYHSIGGDRVKVDYANMVTAFDFDFEEALFVNDTMFDAQMLPRLNTKREDELKVLHHKVSEMAQNPVTGHHEDWQSIADMFVQRYGSPLRYFVSEGFSGDDLKKEVRSLLRPFVADETNDTQVVTKRCLEHILPPTWHKTFAGRVVQQIGHELCFTLARILLDPEDSDNAKAAASNAITRLVDYLAWPIWRECVPSCDYGEVCVLPIWPLTGRIDDRERPSCKNADDFERDYADLKTGLNYWYAKEEW